MNAEENALFFIALKGFFIHILQYFGIVVPSIGIFLGGYRSTFREVILIETVPNYTAVPQGSWGNLRDGFFTWLGCTAFVVMVNCISYGTESNAMIIATVVEMTGAMAIGGFIGNYRAMTYLESLKVTKEE